MVYHHSEYDKIDTKFITLSKNEIKTYQNKKRISSSLDWVDTPCLTVTQSPLLKL